MRSAALLATAAAPPIDRHALVTRNSPTLDHAAYKKDSPIHKAIEDAAHSNV